MRLRPLAIYVSMLGAALAATCPAPATAQSTPADGPWSGYVECTLSAQGDYYQNDEKHVWRITFGAPRPSGVFRVWPAQWTVDGDGARLVPAATGATPALDGPSEMWTASADMSAPISIWQLPGTNTMRIGSQHGVLVAQNGYTVKAGSGGPNPTETTLPGTLQEWQFPTIDAPADATSIVGTRPKRQLQGSGWKQPAGVLTTEVCSWNFQKTAATSSVPLNTHLRDGAPPDLAARFAAKFGGRGGAAATAGAGAAAAGGAAASKGATGSLGGSVASQKLETKQQSGAGGAKGDSQRVDPNSTAASSADGARPNADPSAQQGPVTDATAANGADPTPAAGNRQAAAPSSKNYSSPPGSSSRYRVTVTELLCTSPTRDSQLSLDGRGDEIYAAAFTRQFTRTGQLLEATMKSTREYGDTKNAPARVQAGSQSAEGGIRAGDTMPDHGTVVPANDNAFIDVFPWLVWEGSLGNGGDVLLLTMSIWESDDLPANYEAWVNRQRQLNYTVFAEPQVGQRVAAAKGYTPLTLGATTQGDVASSAVRTATDAALDGLFLPYSTIMDALRGGGDRPVGLKQVIGSNDVSYPNTVVVLTREIIESALATSATAIQNPVDFRQLLILPPGYIAIAWQDTGDYAQLSFGPGSYVMILRIQNLDAPGAQAGSNSTTPPSDDNKAKIDAALQKAADSRADAQRAIQNQL